MQKRMPKNTNNNPGNDHITPPSRVSDEDIGNMITVIAHSISMQVEHRFTELGLSYTQTRALTKLLECHADGIAVNQRALEHTLNITAPSVSSLLRGLERDGYITKVRNPEDSRNNVIVPTEKTLNIRTAMDQQRLDTEKQIAENLTEEQMDTFRLCLRQVLKNLSAPGRREFPLYPMEY